MFQGDFSEPQGEIRTNELPAIIVEEGSPKGWTSPEPLEPT